MGRIIRFYVIRPKDAVEVWLMNNKGFAAGCHFVNVTKGHICPCEFDNFESAIEDLNKQIKEGRLVSYVRLPDMLSEPLENKEAENA